MAEEYRTSPQWQALNRIWKAVPQSAREGVKADFKTVTDFVKATYAQSASETPRLETPRPETRASAAPPRRCSTRISPAGMWRTSRWSR